MHGWTGKAERAQLFGPTVLQRDDPTAKFRPSSIGHTGRLLPPDASGVSPPQAHDSDDAARRIDEGRAPLGAARPERSARPSRGHAVSIVLADVLPCPRERQNGWNVVRGEPWVA